MGHQPASARPVLFSSLFFLPTLLFSLGSAAVDGVLEIDQTCALNTGCFSGDTAGFPVTITQSGSYRLTGSLDLSALPSGTTGVDINASYVTLDLNGFSIMGPSSCTGFGASLNCTPGATGTLAGTGVLPRAGHEVFTIRNGVIRGMTGAAISGGGVQVLVEAIQAGDNAGGGIFVEQNSIVRQSLSRHNGGNGIDVDAGSIVENSTSDGNANHGLEIDGTAVVRGSTFRANGNSGVRAQVGAVVTVGNSAALLNTDSGFVLQPGSKYRGNVSDGNGMADDCGGGICTDERRIRLEAGGDGAFNAGGNGCPAGFQVASIHDLMTADLAWDPLPPDLSLIPTPWVVGPSGEGCGNTPVYQGTLGIGTIVWLPSGSNLDEHWRIDSATSCSEVHPALCVEVP